MFPRPGPVHFPTCQSFPGSHHTIYPVHHYLLGNLATLFTLYVALHSCVGHVNGKDKLDSAICKRTNDCICFLKVVSFVFSRAKCCKHAFVPIFRNHPLAICTSKPLNKGTLGTLKVSFIQSHLLVRCIYK